MRSDKHAPAACTAFAVTAVPAVLAGVTAGIPAPTAAASSPSWMPGCPPAAPADARSPPGSPPGRLGIPARSGRLKPYPGGASAWQLVVRSQHTSVESVSLPRSALTRPRHRRQSCKLQNNFLCNRLRLSRIQPHRDGVRPPGPSLNRTAEEPDGRDAADDRQRRDGDLMTRRQVAAVTSEHTLKIEAARAGVGVEEYQARLRQGLLWCYRCQDWHQAEAFPAERAATAAGADHAARPSAPPPTPRSPPAASSRRRRPMGDPAPRTSPAAAARRAAMGLLARPGRAAPGRDRAGTWSPALDDNVARFPGAGQARDTLITAFGGASAVPPGCRLVRLA